MTALVVFGPKFFFKHVPALSTQARQSWRILRCYRAVSPFRFATLTMATGAVRPKAVVIAGPSGVGKGTLIQKLRKEFPALFGFSVSHTTRAPRSGEQDGVHYNFTTVPDMQAAIADGRFIEHAEVHGKFYGTSIEAVEMVRAAGKICIIEIDVQGCRLVREKKVPAKFFFIAPPSTEELEERLRGRNTEDESSILKRLANARGEMEAKDEPGLFDQVIVNDVLDAAYDKLKLGLRDEISTAKESTCGA